MHDDVSLAQEFAIMGATMFIIVLVIGAGIVAIFQQ